MSIQNNIINPPNSHTMPLKEPWFGFVCREMKTIDGRQLTSNCRAIKINDLIEFECKMLGKMVSCRVLRISEHKSIEALVSYEDRSKLLPTINTKKAAIKVYEEICPNVSKMITFEIEPLIVKDIC
jgi:ASC-1-like (ASCH) protein